MAFSMNFKLSAVDEPEMVCVEHVGGDERLGKQNARVQMCMTTCIVC